jgi:hypothetical protein
MRNVEQAVKAFRLCTSSQIDIGSISKFELAKRHEMEISPSQTRDMDESHWLRKFHEDS